MRLLEVVLIPCRAIVYIASVLAPSSLRCDWRREWLSEIWHQSRAPEIEKGELRSIWRLYCSSFGSLADAWWQFREDGHALSRLSRILRSPRFCLSSLGLLFLICFVVSGFLPATRTVLFPLPYQDGDRMAIVSRTGRMEPVRRGIPKEIAQAWLRNSHLIDAMASSSFATQVSAIAGGRRVTTSFVTASSNLFDVLGVAIAPAASHSAGGDTQPAVYLSHAFWEKQLHGDSQIVGTRLLIKGRAEVVAGILPVNAWFLSPAIGIYRLQPMDDEAGGLLVVHCRPHVSTSALERELAQAAEGEGYAFVSTAPHAVFLPDAQRAPISIFAAACFLAMVLAVLAHGPRWMRLNNVADWLPSKNWRWWKFFFVKTLLALLLVFIVGLELFVAGTRQTMSEALGGPALMWFYIVGCNAVLLASISDQRARCRVCQRLLGLPIQIGCPGCLLLDWAGTEFLCPQGHGVLYVPHHVACWEQEDTWVLLET
jgi:hypothetical protein